MLKEYTFIFGDMVLNHKDPRLFFHEEFCYWTTAGNMVELLGDNPNPDNEIKIYAKKLTHDNSGTSSR